MTALLFLTLVLLLSGLGSAVLVLRNRKPTAVDWSIEEFRREMQALAPDAEWPGDGHQDR